MMFDVLKGKKKREDEELPPEMEKFRLPGPPFAREPEAPVRKPFVPEEFAEERFPSRPGPREPEEDRIAVILHKLDIIDARLKIIEEKLR